MSVIQMDTAHQTILNLKSWSSIRSSQKYLVKDFCVLIINLFASVLANDLAFWAFLGDGTSYDDIDDEDDDPFSNAPVKTENLEHSSANSYSW